MEVGPSTWHGTKPYTTALEEKTWQKTRGITPAEASTTDVEKSVIGSTRRLMQTSFRHFFSAGLTGFQFQTIMRSPPGVARHTKSKLALTDPALALSLGALKAEISKPTIWT